MEDLISFDIWGKAIPDRKQAAIDSVVRLRPRRPRTSVLRDLAMSVHGHVLIGEYIAYTTALSLCDDLKSAFNDLQIYQTGYGPDEIQVLNRCPIHLAYYAGVLGCPVCSGWIKSPNPLLP